MQRWMMRARRWQFEASRRRLTRKSRRNDAAVAESTGPTDSHEASSNIALANANDNPESLAA